MAMSRNDYGSLLEPTLRKLILMELSMAEMQHERVFKVEKATKQTMTDQQLGDFGLFTLKPEGSIIDTDTSIEQYQQTYTPVTFAKQYSLTWELNRDDLYGFMKKMSSNFSRSARQTSETNGFDIFNNGFTGTDGPDSLALFHTAHTRVGSATTDANRPTTDADLSTTSYQAAITTIRTWLDTRDKILNFVPKYLIVPVELEQTAIELLKSNALPYTADNTINVNAERAPGVQIISSPFLTDADAWFIQCTDHELWKFTRDPLMIDSMPDFDTNNWRFKAWYSEDYGWSDWRGLYGTSGN